MKIIYILVISASALIFSACSSKEVFKPLHVKDDWKYHSNIDAKIEYAASEAALLDDRKVMALGKILDVSIPQDHKLLGYSDGWVISSNIDGNMTLVYGSDVGMKHNFNLKKTVAAASVKGDLLAVLFADNEMALYSVADNSLLFKEQGSPAIVVTSKIIKPYIREELVIFSTLDGKIVIVNSNTKKRLRTVIVSALDHFNNIIFFDIIDNRIIGATPHKILSLSQEEIRSAYDIRDVASDGKNIFVATKQGEIISLDQNLAQNAKLKFPFAHFLGMIINRDRLYVLEKEGYLIDISTDMKEYTVWEADFDEGALYTHGKVFFVGDEYISVE